jgi:hypothetical protein
MRCIFDASRKVIKNFDSKIKGTTKTYKKKYNKNECALNKVTNFGVTVTAIRVTTTNINPYPAKVENMVSS